VIQFPLFKKRIALNKLITKYLIKKSADYHKKKNPVITFFKP